SRDFWLTCSGRRRAERVLQRAHPDQHRLERERGLHVVLEIRDGRDGLRVALGPTLRSGRSVPHAVASARGERVREEGEALLDGVAIALLRLREAERRGEVGRREGSLRGGDELLALTNGVRGGERERELGAAFGDRRDGRLEAALAQDALEHGLRQRTEPHGERARANGIEQAVRATREQDEVRALRGLFERLEQRVRGLRRQLVGVANDEDEGAPLVR